MRRHLLLESGKSPQQYFETLHLYPDMWYFEDTFLLSKDINELYTTLFILPTFVVLVKHLKIYIHLNSMMSTRNY